MYSIRRLHTAHNGLIGRSVKGAGRFADGPQERTIKKHNDFSGL